MPHPEEKSIEDAHTWIKTRTLSQIANDAEDLSRRQLHWLRYVANGKMPNAEAVIQSELKARNDYSKGAKSKGTARKKEKVWDSGLEILEDVGDLAEHLTGAKTLEEYVKDELGIEHNRVVIPEEVRKTCVALQNKVNDKYGGKSEFGVLFKGEWTEKGFIVKPDFAVPEQTVSRAHIHYDEDLKKYRDEGYIVNIHSHPGAGESSGFSGVDDEHINSHFDMAVLFAGGAETLVDAVANVEIGDGVSAQLNPVVKVVEPELPDVSDELEKIETKTKTTESRNNKLNKYHRRHGHGYYGRRKEEDYKEGYEESKKSSQQTVIMDEP